MKEKLIKKWDNLIYRIARNSICRMCNRNPGLAYLFILHLGKWLEKNPISQETQKATEMFFENFKSK